MSEEFNYNIDFENRRSLKKVNKPKPFFSKPGNKMFLADLIIIGLIVIGIFIFKPIFFGSVKFEGCKFSGEAIVDDTVVKSLITVETDKFIFDDRNSLILDVEIFYGDQCQTVLNILNNEEVAISNTTFDIILSFDKEEDRDLLYVLKSQKNSKEFNVKIKNYLK